MQDQSGIDVSVVVPVYNPGDYIEPCITSLLSQTHPADRLELIFVDDGSSDATPGRLDRLAAEHGHVRVIHRENSGWSGQPRNDGIAIASGTMIQFLDQDDWLGEEALARMFSVAERTQADIVLGKVVSNGRRVPHYLFARNLDFTSIAELPLEDSLTPHKMFRRSMLLENAIRFPVDERLEDQPFVLRSYFAARNVAVVGTYPCYHYMKRADGANLSFSHPDPAIYYKNLRAIIDIVEGGTDPGPVRDRILQRFYRSEVVGRVSEPGFLRLDEVARGELVHEARNVARERFGPAIIAGLRPITRIRAELLEAGRADELAAFARAMAGLKGWARVGRCDWEGSSLRLDVRAGLVNGDGSPLELVHVDGKLYLDPRMVGPLVGLEQTLIGSSVDVDALLRCSVFLIERGRFVEWPQSSSFSVDLVDVGHASDALPKGARLVQPVLSGTARLDPQRVGRASRAQSGIWDVSVRVSLPGLSKLRRLAVDEDEPGLPHPVWTGKPPHLLVPFSTEFGNLSIDVSGGDIPQTARLKGHKLVAERTGQTVQVRLPFPTLGEAVGSSPALVVLSREERRVTLPAHLQASHDSVAVVASLAPLARHPKGGTWDASIALEQDEVRHGAGQIKLSLWTGIPAAATQSARALRHLIGPPLRRLRGPSSRSANSAPRRAS